MPTLRDTKIEHKTRTGCTYIHKHMKTLTVNFYNYFANVPKTVNTAAERPLN